MEKMKDLTLKIEVNVHIINMLASNTEIVNKVSKFQAAVEQLNSNQNNLADCK
jgi:hypothetical protein